MGPDVTIRGASQLAALAARFKAAGDGGARRDLLRGIRTAAKPLVGVAKESARTNLPHTGGLNEVIASSKFGIRTRTSGSTPGVRVVAVSGHDIDAIDKGQIRHPDYAKGPRETWTWSTQPVAPGWFTRALMTQAPAVRVQIIAAMHLTARRVTR